MPFLVRYTTNSGGTWNCDQLIPGPTEVEYPDYREFEPQTTQDGAVIVQRPLQDARPRRWSWVGYNDSVPNYTTLWTLLESLESRTRIGDGEDPIIQVWEDESGEGGFGLTTDAQPPDTSTVLTTPSNPSNLAWVDVKFLQVSRKTQKGGGVTKYPETFVEMYIYDVSWENF